MREKNKDLTLNEVKECFVKGVQLKNIKCVWGGLLYNCILNMCPPYILKFLIDMGVEDEKTTIGEEIYINNTKQKNVFQEEYCMYATCKNLLISSFNTITNNIKNYEQLINTICLKKNYKYEIDQIPLFNYNKDIVEKYIDLINEYCKTLNIPFEEITNDLLELPENIFDWDSIPDWNCYI